MGDLTRVTASFFKDNKIKYYNEGENKLVFTCLFCGKEAHINSVTTTWFCHNCSRKGNLSHLINCVQKCLLEIPTFALYNPKKARYKINFKINRLINLFKENNVQQKGLIRIKNDLNILLDYYEKKT